MEDLLGYYNDCREHQEIGEVPSKRWEKAIQEGRGKLTYLSSSIDLDAVFSLHVSRSVKKDGTITFKGKEYKIGRFPGEEVTICFIPQNKIMIYKGKDKIGQYQL